MVIPAFPRFWPTFCICWGSVMPGAGRAGRRCLEEQFASRGCVVSDVAGRDTKPLRLIIPYGTGEQPFPFAGLRRIPKSEPAADKAGVTQRLQARPSDELRLVPRENNPVLHPGSPDCNGTVPLRRNINASCNTGRNARVTSHVPPRRYCGGVAEREALGQQPVLAQPGCDLGWGGRVLIKHDSLTGRGVEQLLPPRLSGQFCVATGRGQAVPLN